MPGTRVVKRYANRKLYDTEEKRYVTLEQVAQLIRDGAEIKVVDNESGEDLTSVTLSQILVEQEKKREGGLPKTFLTELVKSSTTLFDYLRKTVTTWLNAANISEEAVEKHIDDLVKKGQLTLDEGVRLKRDIVDRTREFMGKIDQTIENRVGEVMRQLSIPTKAEFDQFRERLAAITKRYEDALTKLEEARGGGEEKPATPAAPAPKSPAQQASPGGKT
jgi:polyhydroxyalkanoate synthesis repressor PhaR